MEKNRADKNKILKPRIKDESEKRTRRLDTYKKYRDKRKTVSFRLSIDEHNKYLREAMKLNFGTLGAFAKAKFLHQPDKPFVPITDRKLAALITTKIGNNINQCARVLNTYKSQADSASLLQELQTIKNELQIIVKILKRDC